MKNLPLTLLLLPTAATAQSLVRVCGSTYSDASLNCTVNPGCPTGDGCPEDKDTCFALPEDACQSPPTAAPTLQVCGTDYEDAQSSCDKLCEGGCGAMEACFNVLSSDCVEDSAPEMTMVEATVEAVAIMGNSTDVTVCGLSFSDAAANCETNTPCSPTGNECGMGEACFVVPLVNCTITVTGSTDMFMNSTSPSLSAADTTAPAPTAPPVEPTHVFVCGVDYDDAEIGCSTNVGCPSGDGCAGGETCFAVPYANCRDAPATTVATITTGVSVAATEAVGSNVSDTLVGSTVVAIGSTESANVADATTAAGTTPAAGEPNLFFCGESYELAETMCSTNVPCPGGGGCPEGQACFGIPSECKSPEPTLSPSMTPSEAVTNATIVNTTAPPGNGTDTPALTTTEPSLAPVSSAPTEAPVVNTHFCGANYLDAIDSCSTDRACPGGFECPGGQTCFTGITCEATASNTGSTASAQTTPVASPGASTSPTLRGTSAGSVGASIAVSETVNLDNLLVFRYCGFSPDDARDNCATATPCLDGTDTECPSSQACFELEEACSAVPGGVTGNDTFPAFTPVTTSAPTVLVTAKPVFDPNVTSFCGVDYDDAQANCFYATPCPENSNAECDDGQTCFPGITTCEIPETPPPTPVPESEGGNETDVNGTLAPAVPTVSPTPKPQYDLSGYDDSNSGRDGSGSVTQKCSIGVLISGVACAIAALM